MKIFTKPMLLILTMVFVSCSSVKQFEDDRISLTPTHIQSILDENNNLYAQTIRNLLISNQYGCMEANFIAGKLQFCRYNQDTITVHKNNQFQYNIPLTPAKQKPLNNAMMDRSI